MKKIPKAAIAALQQAADEMSNNTCNDYMIEDTKENRKFLVDMAKHFDEEDFDIEDAITDDGLYTTDWMVLQYVADLVEEANE